MDNASFDRKNVQLNYVPQYGKMQVIRVKICYVCHAFTHIFIEKILMRLCCHHSSLRKFNEDVKIKIAHMNTILLHRKLPAQLNRYLVASARNLPSLKSYFKKNIKAKCVAFFEDFKSQVTKNCEKSDVFYEKEKDRVLGDLEKLAENIQKVDPANYLGGICHAMITTVAKNVLYSSSGTSLEQLIKQQFVKGVDEDIAGLQLFLDAHTPNPWTSYAWNQLDAVDSLLGICSVSVKPQEVSDTRDGLFHIAFQADLYTRHSILLKFHSLSNVSELIDPNLGVFTIPTPHLRTFLKNLQLFYMDPNVRLDNTIIPYEGFIFHAEDDLEIRQLNKAAGHQWMLTPALSWARSRYSTA